MFGPEKTTDSSAAMTVIAQLVGRSRRVCALSAWLTSLL